jgi:hypothetical protein
VLCPRLIATHRRRVLATTLIAGALGVGGLATGTSAFAADNDPTPPSGSCVNRQIKEHNGFWFVCEGGKWVYSPIVSRPAADRAQDTTTKPVKPVGPDRVPVAPPRG